MNDELRERLRAAAEDFRPDSDRMWERISGTMSDPQVLHAAPARNRFRVPHLVIATGAAVVLIAAIVVIGYGAGPGLDPVPPTHGPAGEGETAQDPDETEDGAGPRGKPEATDGLDRVRAHSALSGNSIQWWSQANIVVTVEERITDLTVELYVLKGIGVEETGSWTTSDYYFAPAEVSEDGDYLVYRWTLVEGRTLAPGDYTLAGQYNHQYGWRSVDQDYFVFEAVADSGEGRIVGDVLPGPDGQGED